VVDRSNPRWFKANVATVMILDHRWPCVVGVGLTLVRLASGRGGDL
jgi:hypothetical protein